MAAHRVPPQLLGMIPTNAGGFGDVEKAKQVFVENEITPIQAKMLGLNTMLGIEAFRFSQWQIGKTSSPTNERHRLLFPFAS